MPAGFAVISFGPIRPTDVPRLPVYVSRSRLTVRMGCYGTRMRSCGVHRRGSGGTFALGRPVFAAMRLRYGGWDCCEPKRKKLRGEHEGTRIGPLTGHMGRGRTSMTNTRRAKARRRFRNRRFRYVTRAAGRGQRCRHGGNLEGTDNRKESRVIGQNVCPFWLVFLCGGGRFSCSSCMGGELEVGQNVCPEWPVRPCGTTVE